MCLTRTISEQTFRTYVRRRRRPRVPASQISPVGSCEGAAAVRRPGAADGSWERAALCQIFGAAKGSCELSVGGPPKIWLLKSNLQLRTNVCFLKIWFFLSNFQPHSHKHSLRRAYERTNVRNLKKLQIYYIIYIESERRKKTNSFPSLMKGLRFLRGNQRKIIWKVLKFPL